MLYLIGVGLKPKQLTIEALEAIKECDSVFLEDYTSEYSEGFERDLAQLIQRDVIALGRKEVEENFKSALITANKNKVALLVFGNPLTATTHLQLLLDAKENGIKTKVIPGISITNMIAQTGLDEYKFGRIATICFHEPGFEPDSFYEQIKQNQLIGLHTLCLLDIKKDTKPKKLMNAAQAIEVLEKIAKSKNEEINFEYLALLAMASEKQKIIFGKNKIFENKEVLELFPQSLIIIGKINEKEKEALNKFFA